MKSLIDIDMLNATNFDYTKLDEDTSNELQDIATKISAINSNSKYLTGEELYNAQNLLARKGYGCFIEWIESYGLKRQVAYNCINYYKVFFHNVEKQEELKQLPYSKVYKLGKLEPEQQKNIIENVNLKDMTIEEVENLTKKLKAEQEYSKELQNAIKQKEEKINELQNKIDSIQISEKEIVEKEVIKEVIPNSMKEEINKLKEEKNQLLIERNKYYEKAKEVERDLKEVKVTLKSEQTDGYRYQEVSEIGKDVKYFLEKCSKYTYFGKEYRKLSWQHKKIVEDAVKKVDAWVEKMKEALQSEKEISEDLIYGEGEIIDG